MQRLCCGIVHFHWNKHTESIMQKAIYLWLCVSFFIVGCGGDSAEAIKEILADPNAPILGAIGNKTVTSGTNLSFTVAATDPNNLTFTLATDGTVGSDGNPYVGNGNNATFSANTGQFMWDTTGITTGVYSVEFSVMNSASLSDSEIIAITVQAQQTQFTEGQTLYNNNCRGSGCHRNEDDNLAEGASFGVLCSTEAAVKLITESGLGSMPTFNFTAAQEAAISVYLLNVRPQDC